LQTECRQSQFRQDRHAVLSTFAITNHKLPSIEINILHSQTQPFIMPESSTVKELPKEQIDAAHLLEDCGDLRTCWWQLESAAPGGKMAVRNRSEQMATCF